MQNDLTDRIYESAFLPEKWPRALEQLAPFGSCTDAAIFVTDSVDVGRWITTESTSSKFARFLEEGWMARFAHGRRAYRVDAPRFTSEIEISTPEEIAKSEVYQKFFRPERLYWGAKAMIKLPFESKIAVSVRRPYELGPLTREETDRLTALRPELARASMISTRLQVERARSTLDTLEALGLPAAALSREGRLALASLSFQKLIPSTFQDRRYRLRVADEDADTAFRKFLERGTASGATIPLKGREDRAPQLIHIVPIVGNSLDLFSLASWVMVVVPIAQLKDAQPELLKGLFDLTPGEARVAHALASGLEIDAAAAAFGVSPATVRSQLKSIFAKTGTRRQADLVALLSATQTLRRGA